MMKTDKIRAGHLARDAWLYIRQSSPRQVMENRGKRPPPVRPAGQGRRTGLAPRADQDR